VIVMKILMLNYEYPPIGGGAANACFYMLKELAKYPDVQVDLVTSSPSNQFETLEAGNKRIFRLNIHKKKLDHWTMPEISLWGVKAYEFALDLAGKEHYDLCHCWFGWPSGLIGYRLKGKMPYIVALRGSDVPGYNARLSNLDRFVLKPVSRIVWRNASKVIANSEGLKNLALKTLNCNIQVIHNGVDLEEFKPAEEDELRKRQYKLRLISTGRLIERKGYDSLIRALYQQPRFELTLIGDGDQKYELWKLARELDVQVKFLGRLDHRAIAVHLQAADVFVLASQGIESGISLLEAMACGLPVIVTDVGGTRELVRQGYNGFICRKGSLDSLREALEKLNRKNITEMGRESRSIAEGFGWGRIVGEYMRVYRACIGGG